MLTLHSVHKYVTEEISELKDTIRKLEANIAWQNDTIKLLEQGSSGARRVDSNSQGIPASNAAEKFLFERKAVCALLAYHLPSLWQSLGLPCFVDLVISAGLYVGMEKATALLIKDADAISADLKKQGRAFLLHAQYFINYLVKNGIPLVKAMANIVLDWAVFMIQKIIQKGNELKDYMSNEKAAEKKAEEIAEKGAAAYAARSSYYSSQQ